MIHFKPITAFNKMVSSKGGSLDEGSGDAFLCYPSKSNISGSQYNPLEAAYSLKQTVSSWWGSLGGRPSDAFLPYRSKSTIFRTPYGWRSRWWCWRWGGIRIKGDARASACSWLQRTVTRVLITGLDGVKNDKGLWRRGLVEDFVKPSVNEVFWTNWFSPLVGFRVRGSSGFTAYRSNSPLRIVYL